MDFYDIRVQEEKDGTHTAYADWIVAPSRDLLVNHNAFQAIWDESTGLWSTNEYDVQRLVDADLYRFAAEYEEKTGAVCNIKALRNSASKAWQGFQTYIQNLPENRKDLDGKLAFENSEVQKNDYATKRLPYPLLPGDCPSWEELISTLYDPEERAKIEWAIGAVVSGDSVEIQKFLVFYGKPGSGKSTIMDVIQLLFDGYTTIFNARELTSSSNQFALAPFKHNPLVAIQHDGDLSRIEDNTQLNMITAHEHVIINDKFAKPYPIKSKAMLFMASNDPVKIKNAKAGIIRRLIDVVPSGRLIEVRRYHDLREKIKFELGAIAAHCLARYSRMGTDYYMDYRPTQMMYETDVFYNFVEAHHDIFKQQDSTTLKQAWALYKEYCDEAGISRRLPQHKFRAELSNYFNELHERTVVDGVQTRNYYSGYRDIMKPQSPVFDNAPYFIMLDQGTHMMDGTLSSAFDELYSRQPAQYTKEDGTPLTYWDSVTTKLEDLDTSQLHYVQVPEHHIVIDFDLVNEDGEKDITLNLEAARHWPPTYTELSKSGKGLHLHYIYQGDVHELAQIYDVGIEVKTLLGNQSLRRKLTRCNSLEIATISSGLPKKEKKPVLEIQAVRTEKGLRDLIDRNIRKEIHAGTKPSIDFIKLILDEAYEDELNYDVRDMRPKILAFATRSTNHSRYCVNLVREMEFVGKNNMPPIKEEELDDSPIIFFDVEVFSNLFVVCWKSENNPEVVRMINPSPSDVEPLLGQKLVGFYNRRYDNHILYARYMAYDLEDLFRLSTKLINNNRSAPFGEAYEISYADIYDFSSVKQGLKKWELDLGIPHMELDLPWDQPVPDDMVDKVVEYCVNDVLATEAVFHARRQDFVARQILASVSGLSVNHTTRAHTEAIIFGDDKHPQDKFNYPNLAEEFNGYVFDGKDSTYRGETTGEGGYVYAEPGAYSSVAVLDIASMHPTTMVELDLFGPYTARFKELMEARLAIKRGDFDRARDEGILGGHLREFLVGAEDDPADAEALAYALKIVINTVYGLTATKYETRFKDPRNKENAVAKRGALFMIDLKHAIQEKGWTVVHIKTDSVKIPDATPEQIEFVMDFGDKYGYTFEHEDTYERFCLVNDAVYIARSGDRWIAVGKQFQHPYVYKTLFTHEGVEFDDLCETRSVLQGEMYLDPTGEGNIEEMTHVGRTGSFVPVKHGGGALWRVKDGKTYAVTGTKGYRWVTRDVAAGREELNDLHVDMDYFEHLADVARKAINTHIPLEEFTS